MTEGIDTATSQAGISFAPDSTAFVIVKAGGANVLPQYVAPHYAEQVDAARKAGKKVGHYWLVGGGQPVSEADYFTSHLRGFDKAHDVLALDNERLDSNPAFWHDADAAAFLARVIKNTGIHPQRVWLYMGAADARSTTWAAVLKLGVRFWIASYGPDDGQRHEAPALNGVIPWHIHQYTSRGSYGGRTVDRSYSPLSVSDLFSDPVPPKPVPVPTPAPAPSKPTEENPMDPVYFKGDKKGDIFILNRLTGVKRHVLHPEWQAAKIGQHVTVIPQADADAIPTAS